MKLTVIANYGSTMKEISQSTNHHEITDTMNSIDWNNFHQVVLAKDDNNWIEVGGNLKSDGLSITYKENYDEYLIVDPPTTVEQMTAILLSYQTEDGRFKTENKFDRL